MVDEAGGRDDDVLAEMVPESRTDGTNQLHLQRVCVKVAIHRTVLIYGLQLTYKYKSYSHIKYSRPHNVPHYNMDSIIMQFGYTAVNRDSQNVDARGSNC